MKVNVLYQGDVGELRMLARQHYNGPPAQLWLLAHTVGSQSEAWPSSPTPFVAETTLAALAEIATAGEATSPRAQLQHTTSNEAVKSVGMGLHTIW